MDVNRTELYRLLLAEQLDLLDDAGRERLQAALAVHPVPDRAAFMAAVREALGEDDADMLRAALASGDPLSAGRVPSRTAHRRRLGRLVMVAAASVGILWAAAHFLPHPGAPSGSTETLRLDGFRGGEGSSLDLDAGARTILLDVGNWPEAPVARWELRDGAGVSVATGNIGPGQPGTPMPPIAIDANRLRVAQAYWLVLFDDSGGVLGEWRFATR